MRTPGPPAEAATRDDSAPRWRIAVSGLGRAGVAHAMAIAGHPGCELVGLVDSRADRRSFAKGAGFRVPIVASLRSLLERAQPQAIVVCGASSTRAADVRAAIDAGIATLADGRMAEHAAEADALAAALPNARALVACGAAPLLHPLFRQAGDWLRAGALGPLVRVQASAYVSRVFSATSRPANRDVIDPMADDALMLLDGLVGPAQAGEVRAQALYGNGPDELHAELTLQDGATASLDLSWSVPGYPRPALVVEAEGRDGRLLASDDAIELELRDAPAGSQQVTTGVSGPQAPFEVGEPSMVLAAFVRALHGDAATLALLDAQRALRVTRLREAIRAATPVVAARVHP